MARCAVCGKNYSDPDALDMARNADGRWTLMCARCRRRAADPAPSAGRSGKADAAAGGAPVIDETTFASIEEALETIRTNEREAAAAEEDALRKRVYERRHVELDTHFAFVRDDVQHPAVVLDLSEGGVRFRTGREVRPGQVVRIRVQIPGLDEKPLPRIADIRRVRREEDGQVVCGARFIRRIGVEDVDRRAHRRQAWATPVFLRRGASEYIERADALDVSAGGLRLRAVEAYGDGEELTLRMRVGAPLFAPGWLEAHATVVRVEEVREALYEMGCAFTGMRLTPDDEGAG